jgi:hypothetical protein
MKKCLLCLAVICLRLPGLFGQYYFYDGTHLEPAWRIETGIAAGLMNCLTDLGGNKGNGSKFLKDVNWNYSKPCVGLYASATHRDIIAIRLAFNWGSLTGSDSVLKGQDDLATLRYMRNLNFRTNILEGSIVMEFHPLYLDQKFSPSMSPYLILGMGLFSFNPETYINGAWISLQPLHTEGQGFREYPQRMEYKLRQINIPVGLGAKYELSNLMVLRLEFDYKILCTDYLDDVSKQYIDPALFNKYYPAQKAQLAQRLADRTSELDPSHHTIPGAIRGNPSNNDAYFSIQLKLGLILNRKKV